MTADAIDSCLRVVDAAYVLHDSLQCRPDERLRLMNEGRDRALASVDVCSKAVEASGDAVASPAVQAQLLYLRGKATACTEEGRVSDEAERLLADAVKLSPGLICAWNCLGECFWQRGEYETAKHTFLGALAFERTATTLCHLSMLLRAMSGAAGLSEPLLLESVSLAKESVRLDPTDGKAWAGLGAAHFSCHIHVTSAAEDLHLANRAFTQATKVCTETPDADLIMNHANVQDLLDLPERALEGYTRAHGLDPTLGADLKRSDAWRDLVRICEAIAAKRHTKTRKFAQMLSELPSVPQQTGNGGATALTPLSQLSMGENAGRTVCVKVVVAVPQQGMRHAASHMVLIVSDASENLMALTIYALRGYAPFEAGTTLEVRDPTLLKIEARRVWEGGEESGAVATAGYHQMRVENPPQQLRIDGQAMRPARARAAGAGGGGGRGS